MAAPDISSDKEEKAKKKLPVFLGLKHDVDKVEKTDAVFIQLDKKLLKALEITH